MKSLFVQDPSCLFFKHSQAGNGYIEKALTDTPVSQALTVPAHRWSLSTTSVEGSLSCTASVIESFLLHCLPVDGSLWSWSSSPPPPVPGQRLFLLTMKYTVLLLMCHYLLQIFWNNNNILILSNNILIIPLDIRLALWLGISWLSEMSEEISQVALQQTLIKQVWWQCQNGKKAARVCVWRVVHCGNKALQAATWTVWVTQWLCVCSFQW